MKRNESISTNPPAVVFRAEQVRFEYPRLPGAKVPLSKRDLPALGLARFSLIPLLARENKRGFAV